MNFTLFLLWSLCGQQPVQKTRCLDYVNMDIFRPISERIAIAVIGVSDADTGMAISFKDVKAIAVFSKGFEQ